MLPSLLKQAGRDMEQEELQWYGLQLLGWLPPPVPMLNQSCREGKGREKEVGGEWERGGEVRQGDGKRKDHSHLLAFRDSG